MNWQGKGRCIINATDQENNYAEHNVERNLFCGHNFRQYSKQKSAVRLFGLWECEDVG